MILESIKFKQLIAAYIIVQTRPAGPEISSLFLGAPEALNQTRWPLFTTTLFGDKVGKHCLCWGFL